VQEMAISSFGGGVASTGGGGSGAIAKRLRAARAGKQRAKVHSSHTPYTVLKHSSHTPYTVLIYCTHTLISYTIHCTRTLISYTHLVHSSHCAKGRGSMINFTLKGGQTYTVEGWKTRWYSLLIVQSI
jgi:hypothetical protein